MTLDERLEFLTQSTESLHETVAAQTGQIAQLSETVAAHERRWERLRRIVVAALKASLEDDEPPRNGP